MPKARPRRSKNGGVYTPKTTTEAEERVKRAWRDAGAFTLGTGPLVAHYEAYFRRPPSHYLKGGNLSAAGRKAVVPSRCDLDNLYKLSFDALNGLAYKDDAQIVRGSLAKYWCLRGEDERVVVRLRAI